MPFKLKLLSAVLLMAFAIVAPVAMADFATDPAAEILLSKARLWEARGRADLAQEVIDKVFRIEPDHAEGLALRTEILIHSDQLDAAKQTLQRLRQTHPGHLGIARLEVLLRLSTVDKDRLRQARLLAKRGLVADAAAALRKLFPDGPPSEELALEYWRLVASTPNGWLAAHAGLTALAQRYPDNLDISMALAEHEIAKRPVSRKALRTVIELDNNPKLQRRARAAWRRAVLGLDAVEASIPLIRQYLKKDSEDTAVKERLKFIVAKIEAHRRLLADPAYQLKLAGLSALAANDSDGAEEKLQAALVARPKDVDAIGGMGLLRLRQGHHAEAEGYFLMALELDPENRSKWTSLLQTSRYWGLLKQANDANEAGDAGLALQKIHDSRLIDAKTPASFLAEARVETSRGHFTEAEHAYRHALELAPTAKSTLSAFINFYLRQSRRADAQKLVDALTPAQRLAMGDTLGTLQAGMLRDDADRLIESGHASEAIPLLEQAVALDANDAWLRYDLGRQYIAQGSVGKAIELFEALVARHPTDASARYAMALLQSSVRQDLPALSNLEQVAVTERTAAMARLQRRLWVRTQTHRAQSLMDSGSLPAAKLVMDDTDAAAGEDPDLLFELAHAWVDLGDLDRVRRILARTNSELTSSDRATRLKRAAVLDHMNADKELERLLDQIAGEGQRSETEDVEYADLRMSLALRKAVAFRRAGNGDAALAVLEPLLAKQPSDSRLLFAKAAVLKSLKRHAEAAEIYQTILSLRPEDSDARMEWIAALARSNQVELADTQIEMMLATGSAPSADMRIALAGALQDIGDIHGAEKQLNQALAQSPGNSKALLLSGDVARRKGAPDKAIAQWQAALTSDMSERNAAGTLRPLSKISVVAGIDGKPALIVESVPVEIAAQERVNRGTYRDLAKLLDRRNPWLSSALDISSRSGTPGISQFRSMEIPVEWRGVWDDPGEAFFRADAVEVFAGTLDLSNQQTARDFGSVLLCQPGCNAGSLSQSASGVAISGGYQRDGLRFDAGTTALGFPVTNLVGGIRKDGDIGPLSYSMELSRRPVTSSLLSYAGARDPRTGKVWGAVTANGVRIGLSKDEGGAFGAWSSLGLHRLMGRNVLDNDRLQLMAGGYWRLINEDNRLFSLGLTGMNWHFSEDAGEYTFGHGGYYSPASYESLSLPISWAERFKRFSYVVRGSISTSHSQSHSAPYFPADTVMQAQAVALAPTNFVNPFYSGGSSSGVGRSLSGMWEYQIDPRLFIGGRMAFERSADYTPNQFLFYFRYSLDQAAAGPVNLPPDPVYPSSKY